MISEIKEIFDYKEGKLFRKTSSNPRHKIGEEAGGLDKGGRWIIRYKGKAYKRYRLIWLWHYGRWPLPTVDHINRCPTDDRIENLREADQHLQQQNVGLRKDNKTKVKNISFNNRCKNKPWHVQKRINSVSYNLGYFDTKENAYNALKELEESLK